VSQRTYQRLVIATTIISWAIITPLIMWLALR
jgi:hypothetical protein